MYNRLEFPFQPVFCLQSLPRKAHKAGRSVGMGSSFPMVAPRKARPRLQPQNGTQLPQRGSSGKRIPKSMPITVRSFPMGAASESLSRNEPSERNTLSETRPNGKLRPGIRLQSGMQFPVEPRLGNDVQFALKTGGSDVCPNRPFDAICRGP